MIYGLAQSLALIPGVSRSGATITAGLALGYRREAAAKYSFLLAIPAVVGSGLFKLLDISTDPVEPAWGPIVLATVVSFVIGLAVIAWLLTLHQHPQLPAVRDLPAGAGRAGRGPAAHRGAGAAAHRLVATDDACRGQATPGQLQRLGAAVSAASFSSRLLP